MFLLVQINPPGRLGPPVRGHRRRHWEMVPRGCLHPVLVQQRRGHREWARVPHQREVMLDSRVPGRRGRIVSSDQKQGAI